MNEPRSAAHGAPRGRVARGMLARVALAAFVLVLAVLAVYFAGGGRRTGGAEPAEPSAREVRAGAAELAPVPAAPDGDSAPRRETTLARAASGESAAVAPPATEEGHRLRGVLVHSDRRPAAGAVLVLHYGEEYTEV